MRNSRIIVFVSGVVGLVILFLIVPFYLRSKENSYPMAAAYLDGKYIRFYCVDSSRCFSDINAGDQVGIFRMPGSLLSIESAFYGNNNVLYFFVTGSTSSYLLRVDLATKNVRKQDITSFSTALAVPKLRKMIHGKLVVATSEGQFAFVEDDFSIRTVSIHSPIHGFVETQGSKLIAYGENYMMDGQMQAVVYLIDVNTGVYEKKVLPGPEAQGLILHISSDMKRIFYLYSQGLGMYDISKAQTTVTLPVKGMEYEGRVQDIYHNIWYFDRWDGEGGGADGKILSLSTLKAIIDPSVLLRNEASAKFIVIPFGDNLLVETNSAVTTITQNGVIGKKYKLPSHIINQNHVFIEYQN